MTIASTLRDLGYELTSTLVSDDFDGREGCHTFAVKIVRNGQSLQSKYSAGCAHRHYHNGKPIVLPCGRMSLAEADRHKPTKPDIPTLTHVMSCFVTDAQCVACGQSFEDFAGDMGYNKDSREAERIFNASRDIYFGLIRLAGSEGLEGLFTLFQDY